MNKAGSLIVINIDKYLARCIKKKQIQINNIWNRRGDVITEHIDIKWEISR